MSNGSAANHWRAIEEEKLRKQIKELEKVAEAAAEWAWRGDSCPVEWRSKLEQALITAGYLGVGNE